MEFRTLNVTIDDQVYFPAYVSLEEDWNGFVIPYFTLENALLICNSLNKNQFRMQGQSESHYDEIQDCFIIYEQLDGDDLEPVSYYRQEIFVNGIPKHVYPIGAGSWIWSVATQVN